LGQGTEKEGVEFEVTLILEQEGGKKGFKVKGEQARNGWE